jgi:hypothetical protein
MYLKTMKLHVYNMVNTQRPVPREEFTFHLESII